MLKKEKEGTRKQVESAFSIELLVSLPDDRMLALLASVDKDELVTREMMVDRATAILSRVNYPNSEYDEEKVTQYISVFVSAQLMSSQSIKIPCIQSSGVLGSTQLTHYSLTDLGIRVLENKLGLYRELLTPHTNGDMLYRDELSSEDILD